jgi:hypothetical protein
VPLVATLPYAVAAVALLTARLEPCLLATRTAGRRAAFHHIVASDDATTIVSLPCSNAGIQIVRRRSSQMVGVAFIDKATVAVYVVWLNTAGVVAHSLANNPARTGCTCKWSNNGRDRDDFAEQSCG